MNEVPMIVGVGHNCLDSLCVIEHYPPEDGSTHITSITTQGGGAVATAMAASARLGIPSAILGKLGDDNTGDAILQLLENDGVFTQYIDTVAGGRSSVSYVMINSETGSRTKFPYPDSLPDIEWNEKALDVLCKAKALHIDGTKYDNALRAAEIAKDAGVIVSLDGCSMQKDNDKNRRLASLADILIMNAKYPLRVSGCDNFDEALMEISGWGPKVVISTQGHRGCLAVIDGCVKRFPAYRVKAVDSTGAGDVFHGAFIVGYLSGMAVGETIRFASAVAALKCTQIGGRAGIPTFQETIKFIQENRSY